MGWNLRRVRCASNSAAFPMKKAFGRRYMSHVNCDPVDLVFSTTLLQKAFVAVGKLVACVTWHMSQ